MPHDALRNRTDRLAQLLSDEHGAEILAELQKLGLETALRPAARPAVATSTATPPGTSTIGAWEVRVTPAGPELRRRSLSDEELRQWADVDHVPAAAGATRVVLLGESSGRGFLLDPLLTPALALQRALDTTDEKFQVVDLAHTGADNRDLLEVALQLPKLEPDVIIVYAGNNWVRSRHTPRHLDLLAAALRDGGYPGMRRAYLDQIVAPAIERTLDGIAAAAERSDATVVVVIPEFNLRGWVPDPELELPPLSPEDLLAWTQERADAEAALAGNKTAEVLAITARMARLDHGMSPTTGWLRGTAALRGGQPEVARRAFEDSRDAVCGLLTTHTPRVTRDVRHALATGAASRGYVCIDLAVLSRGDIAAAYPDESFFLDYCHLSSRGIEILGAAVADVIRDRNPGSTRPGDGMSAPDRAVGDILAAVHNSYYRQPVARIEELVQGAVRDPAGRAFAEALLQLLEASGPVWTVQAAQDLIRYPHAARYLAPMMTRSAETLGMWTLRTTLLDSVGAVGPVESPSPTMDLLATAEQGLIDGAFRGITHLPERSFFQSFGNASRFGFRLTEVCDGQVELTYRVPGALEDRAEVTVLINRNPVAELPAPAEWTTELLTVPPATLRPGVNTLELRWPCGGSDWTTRQAADARALARGEYPLVVGVQGEVFDLLLHLSAADHPASDERELPS